VHAATAVSVRRASRPLTDLAVHRAQRGDPDAFETVYRDHAGRVFALCLRMSGDAVAARELTQDVFVHAWEQLGSFRGDAAFGTWLHRLAVNLVLMRWRAEGRRGETVLADDGAAGAVATRESSPALRMDLEAAVAALPPGARQVLVLYDIEGYSHKEIATLMGIAEGTSKAHLFRARRLLREALDR